MFHSILKFIKQTNINFEILYGISTNRVTQMIVDEDRALKFWFYQRDFEISENLVKEIYF